MYLINRKGILLYLISKKEPAIQPSLHQLLFVTSSTHFLVLNNLGVHKIFANFYLKSPKFLIERTSNLISREKPVVQLFLLHRVLLMICPKYI